MIDRKTNKGLMMRKTAMLRQSNCPIKIKIQAMIEDMHVPCSLWPFLVSSKSHCLQDLLIEKTRSHNPVPCKSILRVKTSRFPRSCNTSNPVCTTCCCDGKKKLTQ